MGQSELSTTSLPPRDCCSLPFCLIVLQLASQCLCRNAARTLQLNATECQDVPEDAVPWCLPQSWGMRNDPASFSFSLCDIINRSVRLMPMRQVIYGRGTTGNEPEADKHLRMGDNAVRNGNYNAAITCFNKARWLCLTDAETQVDALLGLGYAYSLSGRNLEAHQALLEAIHINTNDYRVHGCLGHVYHELQQDDRALHEYKEERRLHPGAPSLISPSPKILLTRGDVESASHELGIAQQLDPFNPYIEVVLGNASYGRRDYQKALSHYKKALQAEPSNPSHEMGIARACLALHDANSAKAIFSRLLEMRPPLVGSDVRAWYGGRVSEKLWSRSRSICICCERNWF